MSILQALIQRYERQAARDQAPKYGFSEQEISYAVVIDRSGQAIDTIDLRDTSGKKPRPSKREVPNPVVRTSKIQPHFLWDKTAYALGVKKAQTGSAVPAERGEYDAFVSCHRKLLACSEDDGLQAFLAFLDNWRPDRYSDLRNSDDMLDTNVVFRFEADSTSFLHDRPEAREIWRRLLTGNETERHLCMVTGEQLSIAPVHSKIKGVRGAQTSGASIVSFNQEAFNSFGKKQSGNAPISNRAAFAYTTSLNSLLARGSRNRIQIGDTTTVFWADSGDDPESAEAADSLFYALMSEPPTDEEEAAVVRDKVEKIRAGRPVESAEPGVQEGTRFFVLGLAPNAARLSVRFWHEDTIGRMGERLREHWSDLHIEPVPWRTPPAAWRLLCETAIQGKSENIPPVLSGALMSAILRGSRYPRSLLANVLLRMRSDGNINGLRAGLRAAICKACLARDHRFGLEEEALPVSLNPDEKNPAYRLGRLFAIYEGVQQAAMGRVNATIKDQFYGSASATPAAVFPVINRKAAHHLGSLRKDKGGLAVWYERHLDAVFDGFETAFPRSLGIEEQGRFAIGYYHQRESLKGKPAND